MNLKNQVVSAVTAGVVLLSACKEGPKKAITLKSGITFQVFKSGKGKVTPKIDDIVTMHVRGSVSDSTLFDSYKMNKNEPVPAQCSKPQFNGDIMEIIQLMKEGDSVVAKIPQDSIFRQEGGKPPFAKKGDPVIYQLKMVSLKSKADYEKEELAKNQEVIKKDQVEIDKYIAANNLTNVQKTTNGVSYVVSTPGSGPMAQAGQEVTMNYTGALLDGKKFDSNILKEFQHVSPFKFTLGKGMVIKGWDEAMAQFNKGTKAKIIIPSALGYGAQGSGDRIPPNSILTFDVEVVDIK